MKPCATAWARCIRPPIVLVSVEFSEIEAMQQAGDWNGAARILVDAAQAVERGGAEFLVIATNTMHKLADAVAAGIAIPILHIADATASAVLTRGIKRVALLGTRFTMEEDFYAGRLRDGHGLDVLVPGAEERALIHRVIYEELCAGRISPESRAAFLKIIEGLAARGAEGVILGCTEIGLLIKAADVALPVFDTARIHALAAVEKAL